MLQDKWEAFVQQLAAAGKQPTPGATAAVAVTHAAAVIASAVAKSWRVSQLDSIYILLQIAHS